jgi:hypothetical protein
MKDAPPCSTTLPLSSRDADAEGDADATATLSDDGDTENVGIGCGGSVVCGDTEVDIGGVSSGVHASAEHGRVVTPVQGEFVASKVPFSPHSVSEHTAPTNKHGRSGHAGNGQIGAHWFVTNVDAASRRHNLGFALRRYNVVDVSSVKVPGMAPDSLLELRSTMSSAVKTPISEGIELVSLLEFREK